jgi:hypothetical protein
LRNATERTVSGLWDLIGRLVDLFDEYANYFSFLRLRTRMNGILSKRPERDPAER